MSQHKQTWIYFSGVFSGWTSAAIVAWVIYAFFSPTDPNVTRLQRVQEQLESELKLCKDNLDIANNIGFHLGTFQIPYIPDRTWYINDYLPIYGNKLTAIAEKREGRQIEIELYIDTCQVSDRFDRECRPFEYKITTVLQAWAPLDILNESFRFRITEVNDSGVVLELYKVN